VGVVEAIAAGGRPAGVGPLLAHWRRRKRLSQLELASGSGVSTRHLSFVETGRSRPSRELVLHLAEHLEVPLRERNRLLLAAGFAPTYPETPLNAPAMGTIADALEMLLRSHEPYPALVMNRRFEMVSGNTAIAVLTEGIAPELLAPPINVLRAALHPQGVIRRVINVAEYRRRLFDDLRRAVEYDGDDFLRALQTELASYPAPPEAQLSAVPTDAAVLPVRLRGLRPGDPDLALFSVIATFGTPRDVTVSELSIESFFPADRATEVWLRKRAAELTQHQPLPGA